MCTMSGKKKAIREAFREAVFTRDNHACKVCGLSSRDLTSQAQEAELVRLGTDEWKLDAHHITDRNLMPNGGYCKENGVSLCPVCHGLAEVFHSTGTAVAGFSPDDLYKLIGSSHEAAVKASERLK